MIAKKKKSTEDTEKHVTQKRKGYPNLQDRPSKYPTNVLPKLDMIEMYARHGLSDEQIAARLKINYHTFRHYIRDYEELFETLTRGREDAEIIVENALFKRAIGYNYIEKTSERKKTRNAEGEEVYKMVVTKKVTKHVQGEVSAQKYYLEHRAPNRWSRIPEDRSESTDDGFIDALKRAAREVWCDGSEDETPPQT